jgi:threonine dehydrogenase-like Zn-dependent dehydrogenase
VILGGLALNTGARQVVVRMEASGLCHTDIHAARSDRPILMPLVPLGEVINELRLGQLFEWTGC